MPGRKDIDPHNEEFVIAWDGQMEVAREGDLPALVLKSCKKLSRL
jgi:hypothetical protein